MKYFLLFPLLFTLVACQSQNTSQKNPSNLTQNQTVKIITPDWAVASTLTAMGYPPLAIGDTKTYQQWVAEPRLPADIIDLGARFAPNPERLAQLKPDIIIDNDFYAHLRPLYGNTPHTAVSFAPKGELATWQDYVTPTKQLGEIIHQPEKAEQFLAQSKQRLGELGTTFRQKNPTIKKIAVAQFSDSKDRKSVV